MNVKLTALNKFIDEFSYFKLSIFNNMKDCINVKFHEKEFREKVESYVTNEILNKDPDETIDFDGRVAVIILNIMTYNEGDTYDIFPEKFVSFNPSLSIIKFNLQQFMDTYSDLKASGVDTSIIDIDVLDIQEYVSTYIQFVESLRFSSEYNEDNDESLITEFLESEYINTYTFKENREFEIYDDIEVEFERNFLKLKLLSVETLLSRVAYSIL